MPSSGSTWTELRNGNVGRHIPAKVSMDLRSVIIAMMALDPSARPTPDQLLSHWKLRQLLNNRLYPDDRVESWGDSDGVLNERTEIMNSFTIIDTRPTRSPSITNQQNSLPHLLFQISQSPYHLPQRHH